MIFIVSRDARTMKSILLATLLGLAVVACGATDDVLNTNLAQKAELVVRAKTLYAPKETAYLWYEVEVLKVIKDESGVKVGAKLQVAARRPGLPEGESTLYLERYDKIHPGTPKGRWRLVGGDAATGASHNKK